MALNFFFDWVMLIFVAFSIPFYILFLLTVLINRHKEPFNSSFFSLCFSLGIADMASIFHAYIFVKAPGWSWGHSFWVEYGYQGSFLSYYGIMVLWALAVCQHIGVSLLAINRLTAVAFSLPEQQIWSTRNISIAIAFQWILPLIFVASMVSTEFQYSYWGGNGAGKYSNNVNIDFCDTCLNYEKGYFIGAICINLTANITTCGMYIAVLIIVLRVARKRKKIELAKSSVGPTKIDMSLNVNRDKLEEIQEPVGNEQTVVPVASPPKNVNDYAQHIPVQQTDYNQKRKAFSAAAVSQQVDYYRELRLAASGFLMFIAMFVYFIFLLGVAVGGDGGLNYTYLWNISSDIFSCISPYTLFIMSKQTRLALKKTLTCKTF